MRAYDFEYQVDQAPLLLPDAAVCVTAEDLQAGDSGLDEAGFFHRSLLRPGVRGWEFSYSVLTGQELRYLQQLLAGKGSFLFLFRGLDGQPSQTRCCCTGFRAELSDRRQDVYQNVRFTVKEC